MPSTHNKPKINISDTDMLCALEVHVPGVRAIHNSLSTVVRIATNWSTASIEDYDKKLRRNLKSQRALVAEAFVRSAMSRITANPLEHTGYVQHADLFTLLELAYGMRTLNKTIGLILTKYTPIYTVLTARIAGRNPHCKALDNMHRTYGHLTQDHLKLTQKLNELEGSFTDLSNHYPQLEVAYEAAIEAYATCTDARDSLLLLKDAHHRGFDYARSH